MNIRPVLFLIDSLVISFSQNDKCFCLEKQILRDKALTLHFRYGCRFTSLNFVSAVHFARMMLLLLRTGNAGLLNHINTFFMSAAFKVCFQPNINYIKGKIFTYNSCAKAQNICIIMSP